jgi:hypothetical protein
MALASLTSIGLSHRAWALRRATLQRKLPRAWLQGVEITGFEDTFIGLLQDSSFVMILNSISVEGRPGRYKTATYGQLAGEEFTHNIGMMAILSISKRTPSVDPHFQQALLFTICCFLWIRIRGVLLASEGAWLVENQMRNSEAVFEHPQQHCNVLSLAA